MRFKLSRRKGAALAANCLQMEVPVAVPVVKGQNRQIQILDRAMCIISSVQRSFSVPVPSFPCLDVIRVPCARDIVHPNLTV
jgi:hypothetical protein